MKLHLGCGENKLKGFVNCDISKSVNPDKIVDLERKLPFEDDSVEEIYSRHTFEHIENLQQLMEEIYRICKKNAKVVVEIPYFAHPGAFQDPTHKRFFALRTFDYFNKKNNFAYYFDCNFEVVEKKLVLFVLRKKISKFFDYFINKNQKFYERFFSRILPAEELRVVLRVVK